MLPSFLHISAIKSSCTGKISFGAPEGLINRTDWCKFFFALKNYKINGLFYNCVYL